MHEIEPAPPLATRGAQSLLEHAGGRGRNHQRHVAAMNNTVEAQVAPALLTPALQYLDRGWSVIPLIGKTPPRGFGWARFQKERAVPADVHEWFARYPNLTGVGLVLGPISGGLAVRDFDQESAYWRWAQAHPDAASSLPTVKTARGKHVYFCPKVPIKPQKFNDGELRSDGQYVVLPPSRHPDGHTYFWEFHSNQTMSPIDAHQAGLCEDWSELETSQKKEKRQTTQTQNPSAPCTPSTPLLLYSSTPLLTPPALEEFLKEFIPTKEHDSHDRLVRLARALLRVAQERGQPLGQDEYRMVFEAWYKKSKKFLRPEQSREDYWFEFHDIVDWARVPLGEETLSSAWKIAKDVVPDKTAQRYESRQMQQLVRLCAELQRRTGDKPFWLSSYEVVRLFHVSNATAWSRLRALVRDGVLELVERGNRQKANRYRYLPALPSAPPAEQEAEREPLLSPQSPYPREKERMSADIQPNVQESDTETAKRSERILLEI